MVVKAQPPTPGAPASPFAKDPFIQRLANPENQKNRRRSVGDILHGLTVLKEQRKHACKADEMYEGDVGMVFASHRVRKLLDRQGVDEIEDFNYAKIPVDAIANRLQIAAVKVAPLVTDEEAEAAEEAEGAEGETQPTADDKAVKAGERAIKLLRKHNQLDAEEKSLHASVSKHGEAFLFLWPVEDEKGKVVSVDMRVNTAHTVAFIYDPEDPLQVSYVIKSWTATTGTGGDETPTADSATRRQEVVRANLYYPGPRTVEADGTLSEGPGRVERWVSEPGQNAEKFDAWKRVHDAEEIEAEDVDEVAADEFGDADEPLDADDIPAPFGLTWYHFRNDRPHGRPEHASAYGPQILINKLVYGHAGTIDYMSFPQRYLVVDPKVDDPLLNVEDPDHPDDEEDDPETELGTSGLSADPGSVWKMYGKTMGEFSAADPRTFLDPFDRYIKAMAELTDVPQYAFSKASGDMPSGEAVRRLDGPLLAKVKDRQDRYDPIWQDAYEQALKMMGLTGLLVDVRWVPASPVNDLDGLNVLKAKGEMGVPGEVLLNEAGYPDEQVDEWIASREGATVPSRLADLAALGSAVQALAGGVTAGIVDEAGAQVLISRMIRLIADGTDDPAPQKGALPPPSFREPPPTNPAMAAVEASKQDPLKQAQVEATQATAHASRTSADMMRSGQMAKPGKPGQPARPGQPGQPARKATKKAAPAKKTTPARGQVQ